MAYVVEDGTGTNPLANGYAPLDQIRDYALARGVALSDDDDALSILAIKAMDYLAQYCDRWQGEVLLSTQPLDWPRTGVCYRGAELDPAYLPVNLLNAQAQLCVEQQNGVNIMPTTGGETGTKIRDRYLIEDTTGPLTKKWSEGVSEAGQDAPSMPLVDNLISPLLSVGIGTMRAYRV